MSGAVLLLVALGADPAASPRLVQTDRAQPYMVEVALGKETAARLALAKPTVAQWTAILRVVVGEGTDAEIAARPAVAGTYTITSTTLRFEPQFPLVPGVKYRATFQPAPTSPAVTADLVIPKPPPGPPTSIATIYPSGNRLPENTLRWYIHFTGQMTHGDIYRHIKLVRDDGKEVNRPFLEIDEELWSADGLRVTILFHPGRVKRGLVPREEEGPILEEGRRFTLSISREWKDAEGRPLTADVRREFNVGPPDDTVVNPDDWSLMAPRAGGDAPLILRLAKPLDHALLDSMVGVTDAAGKRIEGAITVGGGERVVTFVPARPWERGTYKLVVDTRLEDVCGNRVGEPFEVDVFRPVERKVELKLAERPFTVR